MSRVGWHQVTGRVVGKEQKAWRRQASVTFPLVEIWTIRLSCILSLGFVFFPQNTLACSSLFKDGSIVISLIRSEINLAECMETSPSDGPGHTPLHWHTESHTGLNLGLPFLGSQSAEGHRFLGSLAPWQHIKNCSEWSLPFPQFPFKIKCKELEDTCNSGLE